MTEPALGHPRMFGAPATPPDPYAEQQRTDPYAGPHPYAGGGQPAAGQPARVQPYPMTIEPPTHEQAAQRHRDFEEVDSEEYRRRVEAQLGAGQPGPPAMAPAPLERPRAEPGQHVADLRAEVAVEQARADPEYEDGAVPVLLVTPSGRYVVHILDPGDWPSDANSSLHIGDYESWADGCLAGNDYAEVWRKAQPRMRDVSELLDRFRQATGQDSGKSLSSPRSYRNAVRR